jgi:hypothetical protein
MAKVPLAGTTYIPGVTEQRTLDEIKGLVESLVPQPHGEETALDREIARPAAD